MKSTEPWKLGPKISSSKEDVVVTGRERSMIVVAPSFKKHENH